MILKRRQGVPIVARDYERLVNDVTLVMNELLAVQNRLLALYRVDSKPARLVNTSLRRVETLLMALQTDSDCLGYTWPQRHEGQ